MALITWADKYSVNVNEIDEQHKKLVGFLNNLHDAMLNGKSKDMILNIIDDMSEYTVYHFSTEEKYMSEFDYPDYSTHKKEHDEFVNKVLEYRKDYETEKVGLNFEIMNFLNRWIEKHIQISDKKYGPLFNENGVA